VADTEAYLVNYRQGVATFPPSDDPGPGHFYGLSMMAAQFLGAASHCQETGGFARLSTEVDIFRDAWDAVWKDYVEHGRG
jgi:hypothetical protein